MRIELNFCLSGITWVKSLDKLLCRIHNPHRNHNGDAISDVACRTSRGSWIGLYKYEPTTDANASAQYWLDGSESTFRRWLPGEPDSVELCIGMLKTTGEFLDLACGVQGAFVCKRTGGQYALA